MGRARPREASRTKISRAGRRGSSKARPGTHPPATAKLRRRCVTVNRPLTFAPARALARLHDLRRALPGLHLELRRVLTASDPGAHAGCARGIINGVACAKAHKARTSQLCQRTSAGVFKAVVSAHVFGDAAGAAGAAGAAYGIISVPPGSERSSPEPGSPAAPRGGWLSGPHLPRRVYRRELR